MQQEEDTLAVVASEAIQLFGSTCSISPETQRSQHVDSSDLEEQRQRFDLWAINIGVHQQGHASLDYRFRDSAHIRQYCYELLTGLVKALEIFAEELSASAGDEELLNVQSTILPTDSDRDDSESSASSDEGYDSETTAQVAYQAIADCIDRLLRLSMKIRDPKLRTGLSKGLRYTQVDPDTGLDLFDCMWDQEVDQNHIWNVIATYGHQKAAEDASLGRLVTRLARANNLRRRQFAYWAQHKLKLVRRTAEFRTTHVPVSSREPAPSLTQYSRPTTATQLETSRVDIYEDEKSTVSTMSISILGADDATENLIMFPDPPKAYMDSPGLKEFECPYCYTICPRKLLKHRAWRAHILKDLRPYVCIFDECHDNSQLYDSFADWASHQLSHPKNHLSSGLQPTNPSTCQFCNTSMPNAESMAQHIAIHLVRFAIFSLPRFISSGTDQDDESIASNRNVVHTDNDTSESSRLVDLASLSFHSRELSLRDGNEDLEGPPLNASPAALEEVEADLPSNDSHEGTDFDGDNEDHAEAAAEEDEVEVITISSDEHADQSGKDEEGKPTVAEQEKALHEMEKALGPEDLTTLDAVGNLGLLCLKQGQLDKAEEMLMRALSGMEKILGKDHPSTLDSMSNVGSLYVKQGKLVEGEQIFLQVLRAKEARLGTEHVSTLDTVSEIGDLYMEQDKLAEAEQMFLRALQGYLKTKDKDDSSIFATTNSLGLVYHDQGRLEKAEEMYQRALNGYENRFGWDFPPTLAVVNNLGGLYRDQGRLEEAEEMLQRALDDRERALGPQHPSTFETRNNIGNLYRVQGKLEQAEEMYMGALAGKEKVLGREHVSTLDTVSNLGILYRYQKKLDQAEEMLKRALTGKTRVLGPDHPSTKGTAKELDELFRLQDLRGS